MSRAEQPHQQVGIQSNSGGDINIEQSHVNIAGGDMHIHAPLSAQEREHAKNRRTMLRWVEHIWITGFLEESLHNKVLITLGLQEQPDAILNPWRSILQELNQQERLLPSTSHIIEAYDQANGTLLILGEPGSGKTTLLLELTRDLLDRANKDDSHPIPVVFNLASWAVKGQPLADWLVEELNTKYQIPRKIGQSWIDNDQVLPLLDGLDEVAEDYRAKCIDAINLFRKDHGLIPSVISCRRTEYNTLAKAERKLQLRTAIVIQPLTLEQINNYLLKVGEQVIALRLTIHNDRILQELARTPLMLNILTLTFHGKPVEEIPSLGTAIAIQRQVFKMYVERMLQRRSVESRYSEEQTKHWLEWLAQQMRQHSQTVFYIERMQPDWLPDQRSHKFYFYFLVKLLWGVQTGSIFGLVFGLTIGLFADQGFAMLVGIAVWFLTGVYIALIADKEEGIEPAELLIWSWRGMIKQLRSALKAAVQFGWGAGVLVGYFAFYLKLVHTINKAITLGFEILVGSLIFGLYIGISAVWSAEMLDKQNIVTPNQGIRYSVRHGLLVGLLSGLIIGLPYGLFRGIVSGLASGLMSGLVAGLVSGLQNGLRMGGVACIRHVGLRFLLKRAGFMPWKYPRFLDYASERILLHKVGGGYIFIHRFLQEYFATLSMPLHQDKTQEKNAKKVQQALHGSARKPQNTQSKQKRRRKR